LFACLFVCLSACLFVFFSVCLLVCLSVCLFVCLSFSVCLFLFVCLSPCLLVFFSVCLFVYLYICLFVCLFWSLQLIDRSKTVTGCRILYHLWYILSIENSLASLASLRKQKNDIFQTGVWLIQSNLTIMAVLGYQKVVDVQGGCY
jgi:hypothetical protein